MSESDFTEIISDVARDQAKKITSQALEIATSTEPIIESLPLFSKWNTTENFQVYMTERSNSEGQTSKLLVLHDEHTEKDNLQISRLNTVNSNQTFFKLMSLPELINMTKDIDLQNYIKKLFPEGTFVACSPQNQELFVKEFIDTDSFVNTTFQYQLFKSLISYASKYDDSQTDFLRRSLVTSDDLTPPSDGYADLFRKPD